ncbi:anaerobic C4-dicarboxylate transporter [Geomonas nitrogeniifigens]|uniref:Anaerobic C4-dicarboxylate transporter n=1 Tax=Geomonas diazotrophica TaxID=2843197 RepID=A0ABX8JEI5_9BACT|nr:anaerobic C4-dicarboxylate transporter [Geomonas nitrogeniifigens]QWV96178.1 anaerobic C4-dicarboxylate transporter [Geomonas nitrogeniifigens]QXE85245.1 anaerobic C4-dicarboxylate transporter [Geomonas nitrogeniifigens]
MFWLEFVVVLAAIFVGARLGGIGLGVMGGLGLAVLTFLFHLQPTAPPIDVMLMIAAVVTAAGVLQAAGGLDYLVSLAERILRNNPDRITFLGPMVTYFFTLFAGTGHVAYSVLPVIAEVARETGVRPERPMSISVIASQQAITASPIAAATVALLGLLGGSAAKLGFNVELIDILKVCIPSTLVGVIIAAFVSNKLGKDLDKDPEYQKRLQEGVVPAPRNAGADSVKVNEAIRNTPAGAKVSVALFLVGTILVVLFGSFPQMRPEWSVGSDTRISHIVVKSETEAKQVLAQIKSGGNFSDVAKQCSIDAAAATGGDLGWQAKGKMIPEFEKACAKLKKPGDLTEVIKTPFGYHIVKFDDKRPAQNKEKMGMPHVIEIVMLTIAALMLLICKVKVSRVAEGSVFIAGIQAVIAIFGIAWMGDTFFQGNMEFLSGSIKGMVTTAPWLFAFALFALSILLYSQAATVRALMPLGISLGIPAPFLIAMFPAVNGYFFIPNYPTVVAAINFDRTGTTGIGRYVLNHSFMIPGLVATSSSIGIGFLLVKLMF